MTNHIKIITCFFVITFLSCGSRSQENDNKTLIPLIDFSEVKEFRETKELGRIVSDYDSIFKQEERRELGNLIHDYNVQTTRQIVVVTIDSLHSYEDIQKFATDLANYLGVGTKEENNGLTLVLCKPERKIGIATGLETERVLTDSICKVIIDSIMIPKFREGDFYSGMKGGVVELIKNWD
ncbi:TPM domain-containing protein [Maribacter sp. 2307UL18-2]|uniref:TPM domain-containing protein n=1 Tax=Maribacter sp. 2307UL18-2 TaxID=3386274 RepID=UPI0039BC6D25